MEVINLYDEFNRYRGSLTSRLLLKATSELYHDFSEVNINALEVELKINGNTVPLVSFLQEYEKVFDEEVSEKASELVKEKMFRLTEILLRLIRERKKKGTSDESP